jgi:endo-1,4-beta-xylanase
MPPAHRITARALLALATLLAGATATAGAAAMPYERWTVSDTIMSAGPAGSFDDVSVKDPAIVYYNGKYHVFYTTKVSREAAKTQKHIDRQRSGLGYVCAPTLAGLNTAPRHNFNDILGEIVIAPQVFYFAPQKLWYLIGHIPLPKGKRPDLQPVYLTNPDIENIHGWLNPKIIPAKKENNDFWIDFWVICDDAKAHLFYTDHRGSMFRMETALDKFPDFSESADEVVLTERGETSKGRWRLHEASHIYYVKSAKKYLALLEAVYPHPLRPRYWDSRSRFMFAMTADKLEGPWDRVEKSRNEFAGDPARLFLADGSRAKHGQVSHFEIIRPGYDQKFELPDYNFVLFFQGFDAKQTPDTFIYDDLPWELALMKNYNGDWAARLPGPSGLSRQPPTLKTNH